MTSNQLVGLFFYSWNANEDVFKICIFRNDECVQRRRSDPFGLKWSTDVWAS